MFLTRFYQFRISNIWFSDKIWLVQNTVDRIFKNGLHHREFEISGSIIIVFSSPYPPTNSETKKPEFSRILQQIRLHCFWWKNIGLVIRETSGFEIGYLIWWGRYAETAEPGEGKEGARPPRF